MKFLEQEFSNTYEAGNIEAAEKFIGLGINLDQVISTWPSPA